VANSILAHCTAAPAPPEVGCGLPTSACHIPQVGSGLPCFFFKSAGKSEQFKLESIRLRPNKIPWHPISESGQHIARPEKQNQLKLVYISKKNTIFL